MPLVECPPQSIATRLYRLPPNMGQWPRPQPTRLQLEGADGLQGSQGKLQGLELVWLRDRLEAYLVQVQGSARLQLKDGGTMSVGVAGHTDYPYVSVGRALVNAGKFKLEELTLPRLIQYFRDNPADEDLYLPQNNRFIFFEETGGAPATGSLGLPVTAERSIATDKSLMPPGALALIRAQFARCRCSREGYRTAHVSLCARSRHWRGYSGSRTGRCVYGHGFSSGRSGRANQQQWAALLSAAQRIGSIRMIWV